MLPDFIRVVRLINIEYKGAKKKLFVESDEESRLLLGDEGGSFFSKPLSKKTRYDGFFWYDTAHQEMFRILDSIILPKINEPPDNVRIEKRRVSSDYPVLKEDYFMPEDTRSLFLKLNIFHSVRPYFDIKKMFDNREWGRIYHVEVKKNIALIHFKKITDDREDESTGKTEFERYVAVAFSGSAKEIKDWRETYYELDEERGSPPISRYVYCPLEFLTDKMVFVPSSNREYAIKKAKKLFSRFSKLESRLDEFKIRDLDSAHLDFAYSLAERNMEILNVDHRFIMAGIPWFHEEWARDEAISLYWLFKENRKKGLELALRMMNHMINGKIKTKIGKKEGIFSIDAFAFIFKRVFDSFLSKESDYNFRKKKNSLFKNKDIHEFVEKAQKELDYIIRYHMKEGLVYSHPKETWMDSTYDIDDREGFNIEVQAMIIYLLEKMNWLTSQSKYSEIAEDMKRRVKKDFWNGSYLVDNLKNPWLRPNMFLAYYFCPSLLDEHEWDICFRNALNELWLDWGGFSTISKKSNLFHPRHTGEDARSYHRGDSWYFINNIAAVVLSQFDRKKYSKQIAKILSASTFDILFGHALGFASELSDAEEQSSHGAFAQAFSASTFLELVDHLFSLER